MRDSGVHVGEGIGDIFWSVFCQGKVYPGVGWMERCQEIIC